MNISTDSLTALAKLRLPSARPAYVLYRFGDEGYPSQGITVETLTAEPAVAAGSGQVAEIYRSIPQWPSSDGTLRSTSVYHVVIDHGAAIKTVVAGLRTVEVTVGQNVVRGDRLGELLVNQLFCSVVVGKKAINPLTTNRHWVPQNGNVVPGQSGKIRFAPDRLLRDLSHGVTVLLQNGIKYFQQLVGPAPLLVNIDFNGDGSKQGLAGTGYTDDDYWNVYTPVDFWATVTYACYYYPYSYYGYYPGYGYSSNFYEFTDTPVLHLNDYSNRLSPVLFQRVAPLFSAAGTAASWDDMLKSWVGGYLGPIPYENSFRILNLPAGTYELYLYGNQGSFPTASTFYAGVNTDPPTSQSNNPTVTPSFIEGQNYVKFTLTVPAFGYVTFKAVGYLCGLQLRRV